MIEKRSANSYRELSEISQIMEKEIWNRNARGLFEMYVKHPSFCLEHTFLIEVNGDIASFLMIIPEEMRIGSTIVKIGWLEFCFTREKYRGKGFFSTLLKDFFKYSLQTGYPLVKVYGAVKLYSKFGLVPCFYHSLISLPVGNMENKQGNYLVRRFRQRHIESVFQFNQINSQDGVCYPVRSKETWEAIRRYHPSKDGLYVAENKINHRVMGYMWMRLPRNNMLWVEEAETMNREASESILVACAKMAKIKRIEKICFLVRVSSNFGQYCQELGAEVNLTAAKPEGDRLGCEDMMKVLDVYELLTQMKPELERRCLNSKYKDWTGRITIKTESDIVRLDIEKSQIRISSNVQDQNNLLKVPNTLFTQLVIGFKDINEIAKDQQVAISPFQIDLISTLFPKLYPHTIAKEFREHRLNWAERIHLIFISNSYRRNVKDKLFRYFLNKLHI